MGSNAYDLVVCPNCRQVRVEDQQSAPSAGGWVGPNTSFRWRRCVRCTSSKSAPSTPATVQSKGKGADQSYTATYNPKPPNRRSKK